MKSILDAKGALRFCKLHLVFLVWHVGNGIVLPERVDVYETWNPGTVIKVELVDIYGMFHGLRAPQTESP